MEPSPAPQPNTAAISPAAITLESGVVVLPEPGRATAGRPAAIPGQNWSPRRMLLLAAGLSTVLWFAIGAVFWAVAF